MDHIVHRVGMTLTTCFALLPPFHHLISFFLTFQGDNPDKRIVLTGHSMGAALCAMTAYQLIHRYPYLRPRIIIVQFGSPKYGRKKFVQWLNTHLPKQIIRFAEQKKMIIKYYKNFNMAFFPH